MNENSSFKEKLKLFDKTHSSKQGLFSAIVTSLVLVITILFNLVVGQLPTTMTQYDLTKTSLYSVSDTSIEYLENLDTDVEIIVLYLKDKVDGRISKFVDTYVTYSPHLSLQYVDPVAYPSLLATYNCEAGSMVVRCPETGRYQVIDMTDIISFDVYAYYITKEFIETEFDCEGLLTSAVDYVIGESAKNIYQMAGHGEPALSDTVLAMMTRNRFASKQVNPMINNGIPLDCDLLIAYNPTRDLSDEELGYVQDYLAKGGQMIYFLSEELKSMPNWDALIAPYGITTTNNYIMDLERLYGNNPYVFFPMLDLDSDVVVNLDENSTLLVDNAHGLYLSEEYPADDFTVTPFLSSSTKACEISDTLNQGAFVLGAVAENENTGARLTVLSTASLIDPEITDQYGNLSNVSLLLNMITASFDDMNTLDIKPVDLRTVYNTISTAGTWSMLYVGVIPATFIGYGLLRWWRRRKL